MFQLRSFIHQRLYAAAEEILGQVERTIRLAVHEAVQGDKTHTIEQQQQLLLQRAALLSSSSGRGEARWESSSPVKLKDGISTADTNRGDRNQQLAVTDFKVVEVKEEEEELAGDSQIVFLPSDAMKSEQELPETEETYELRPISSDESPAQSADSEDDWSCGKESRVKKKRRKANAPRIQGDVRKSKLTTPEGAPQVKTPKSRVCPACGKGFQYIRPFMKHIKTHSRTCESTRELLNSLQSAHSKRLVCDICGKKFTSHGCLQMHLKIHTGVKDFKCQECGKTFVRKEHLMVHVRTHSGVRPYHCDVCGKDFSQSQNLRVHRRSHTGERPYSCDSCGKLFHTSGHLKTHMKRFSGEKPYTCDVCDQFFCQKELLVEHRSLHALEEKSVLME